MRLNKIQPYYAAGEEIVISCTVIINTMSPLKINATIELQRKNMTLKSSTTLSDFTNFTISYNLTDFKLSDAGVYTCSYYLTHVNYALVLRSDTKTAVTNVSVQSKYNFV